jgi:hypothetical protein
VLISELGVPSRVEVYSAFGPGEGQPTSASHDFYVIYDDQGILLRYDVRNTLSTPNRVCLTFGGGGNTEDSILIALIPPPGERVPLEDYLMFDVATLPIEEAAGMTPQEFHDLFTGGGSVPCFNLSPDVLQ